MSKLDREFQRRLLVDLSETYPAKTSPALLNTVDRDVATANIRYLNEHGLIDGGVVLVKVKPVIVPMCITADGMDFLEGDGGLSAILGVVTIRFHEDTLRDLIELKIADSPSITPQDKRGLIDRLRGLPSDAIKHLTMRLLDKGMDQLPDMFEIIQKSLPL